MVFWKSRRSFVPVAENGACSVLSAGVPTGVIRGVTGFMTCFMEATDIWLRGSDLNRHAGEYEPPVLPIDSHRTDRQIRGLDKTSRRFLEWNRGVPINPALFACRAVHQIGAENPVDCARQWLCAEFYQVTEAFNTTQPSGQGLPWWDQGGATRWLEIVGPSFQSLRTDLRGCRCGGRCRRQGMHGGWS